MHQLQPVISHYEDLTINEHHKIWIQVGRVKSEYVRILRLPIKKVIQTKYINKMIELDLTISEAYFDKIKLETSGDDELINLLADNEKLVAQLKNHALTHLVSHAKNLIENGQTMSFKESILLIKSLEMYGASGSKDKGEINKTTSLARQLLGADDEASEGFALIQQANQEATQLRLPNSSL